MSKLIITAGITGSVHIPTMSDYLPLMFATLKTGSLQPTQTYSARY